MPEQPSQQEIREEIARLRAEANRLMEQAMQEASALMEQVAKLEDTIARCKEKNEDSYTGKPKGEPF